MPRVKVGPAPPTLDVELARLRDLDAGALRAGWQNVFRRQPSPQARSRDFTLSNGLGKGVIGRGPRRQVVGQGSRFAHAVNQLLQGAALYCRVIG
jgi:hypothetical protein